MNTEGWNEYAHVVPGRCPLVSSTLDDKSDGYFFDVISNGVRNMPGYSDQIEVEDRWAIVTYLKALRLTRENK